MKSIKKQKSVKKIIIPLAIAAILIVAGIVVALQSAHKDTTSSQQNTSGSDTTRPVNDVDYGPPSKQESEDAAKQKQQIVEQNIEKEKAEQDSSSTVTTSDISVTFARVGQADVNGSKAGQPLNIRAIIYGTTSGNCLVKLTKSGQSTINKTFAVSPDATYATCGQADLPASEFSVSGEWELSVAVQSGAKQSNPAIKTVTIEK